MSGDSHEDLEAVNRRQALERRLLGARVALERRLWQATERDAAQAGRELEEVRASAALAWGRRVARLERELVRGTWAQRRAYLSDFPRRLLRRRLRRPPQPPLVEPQAAALETGAEPVDVERDWFEPELGRFLQRAAAASSEWMFFIRAGSAYIQEQRGHRLHRVAKVLRERGVPVLYSYRPWSPEEPIPRPEDPLLFQCPAWRTEALEAGILRHDFGGKKRVYLIGFPVTACARAAGEASSLGWIVHYDCMDEWEEFFKEGAAPWYDEGAERAGVCFADVVTATAGVLVEKMQSYTAGKSVHLSPNAFYTQFVQPDMVGRTAPREGPLIIGYVGHLGPWWFDWQALAEIAGRMPDAEFEIIGGGYSSEVELPSNVRLLGPKNYAEVNQAARRWRAAMVLRKISPLTAAMDSLKVYEYLALGLPVLCFTMPQIESYPYVFSALDVEGFVTQARRAASVPIDRARIDAFLAVNRWEDRVDQFLRLAEQAMEHPCPLRGLQSRSR